jgi:guanylate kinase
MISISPKGKLIIVSAPSGAGKTTVVHHLLKQDLGLEFSVSACSREKRIDEVDGKDYYFIPVEVFKNKIRNDEFVEWEEVYPGQFYGTLRSEIERIREKGSHVIFDVDVIGGLNLKRKFTEGALALFIMPPSIEELEQRLARRSSDSNESIRKRIEKAKKEISYSSQFDVVIVNDVLEKALEEAEQTVRKFLTPKE